MYYSGLVIYLLCHVLPFIFLIFNIPHNLHPFPLFLKDGNETFHPFSLFPLPSHFYRLGVAGSSVGTTLACDYESKRRWFETPAVQTLWNSDFAHFFAPCP